MRKRRTIIITAMVAMVIVILIGWLFLGIYNHREYGDNCLFIKHRATFKFFFSAPRGESDKPFDQLSANEQYEEIMYRQYVEEGNGYQRSICLW